jgi:hypothetical protein
MQIIETPIFTRRVKSLLSDEEYRNLQNAIITNPEVGIIIRGGGGLRKMRWATAGRGKSGGVRTIYYWFQSDEIILMLFMYSKSEQDDLSPDQSKMLKILVEQEFK